MRLYINSGTWNHKVFELIDYGKAKLNNQKLEVNESGYIYRNINNICFSKNETTTYNEKLFELQFIDNSYFILSNPSELIEDKEFGIVLKNPNCSFFIYKPSITKNDINKYKLNEGDIIKIGRINLRIRKINLNQNSLNPIITTNNSQIIDEKKTEKDLLTINNLNIKNKKKICRICYTDEETLENPLIQPCNCSGTMKFIHIQCLTKWLTTSSCVIVEDDLNCTVYKIKHVECELCQCKLPDYVNHNGKLFEILNLKINYNSYLIIESLTIDKNKNKFLYIINLDKKNIISVGRGEISDLLLSDISVSRNHCKIIKDNNNVFIKDCDSRFGTLILIQNQKLKIHKNLPLYIQIGRSFFEISMKKKSNSCFNCCDTFENDDVFFYQKQNEKKVKYQTFLIIKKDNDYENETENNDQNTGHGLKVIEVDNINENDDNEILLRSKDKKRFHRRSILPEIENLEKKTTNFTNEDNDKKNIIEK